ncbi:MAG TPA: TIGR03435 family protein [Vicinamibacterales bacterium]|nr:TIGR03435 family protein [Vicinamibacterales bacterium]
MRHTIRLGVGAGLLIASMAVSAQSPDPKPLAFEVASIKHSVQLDAGGTLRMQPGGLFTSVNVPIEGLILGAYRTPDRRLFRSQLIGGPSWLTTERYDITARVGAELTARPQGELFGLLPVLLQSLLQDRFKLRVHHETRDLPVYVLTVKNPQFGPGLRISTFDCAATPSACGIQFSTGHVSAASVDVETLINLLSGTVERPLINQTGLSGRFAINLDWSPDPTVSDKPSIFTAAQEQLGLALASSTAPVDVLVIDHVERPTPD